MMEKATRLERRVKSKEERQKIIKEQREQWRLRERNKRIFNYAITTLVLIAVAYGIFVWWQASNRQGQHDALARCLTGKGVTMYGTEWCPHCQDQKQLFGPSFKLVSYINCDVNGDACKAAGVDTYPTWVFSDGTRTSGTVPLESLAERTGCVA